MSYRRRFNFVYTDDNHEAKTAKLENIRFVPYIKFDIVYKNEIIPCHLDKILDEWHISFTNKFKEVPLGKLYDIYWNLESIYGAFRDDEFASAVSKAIYEVYREYQDILP